MSGPAINPPGSASWRPLWLLLVALVLGYCGTFALNPSLFFSVGVRHYPVWFLDTLALLAANDALSLGLDIYAPNPLDYFHRPHVYSHWWLHLRDLGLTRADTAWLGAAVVIGFFTVALVRLRPRTPGEVLWYAAILCSSPVLLAADRANNDLVIFILLAPAVPGLLSPRRGVHYLTVGLITLAAALKYYPAAAALILLAGDNRREVGRRLLAAVILLGIATVTTLPDLLAHPALVPEPEGLMSFGAAAFFQQLGWAGRVPTIGCALAGVIIAVAAWRGQWLESWTPTKADRPAWWSFILGAALLTGCFFTGLNFGYRWIFALWLAPLLWVLPADPSAPDSVRRLARWTRGLLVAVLWWDPLCCFILNRLIGVVSGAAVMEFARDVFLVGQPFVWALFIFLLIFLVHFVRGQVRWLLRGA